MSGSSLAEVLWADAGLDHVRFDYDRLVITVTETTGRNVRVICDGYIGVSLEGFWDESVAPRHRLFRPIRSRSGASASSVSGTATPLRRLAPPRATPARSRRSS